MQERLIKTSLVFLGYDEDLVLSCVEFLRELSLLNALVHSDLGVLNIFQIRVTCCTRERHQCFGIRVAFIRDVLVESLFVPNCMKA